MSVVVGRFGGRVVVVVAAAVGASVPVATTVPSGPVVPVWAAAVPARMATTAAPAADANPPSGETARDEGRSPRRCGNAVVHVVLLERPGRAARSHSLPGCDRAGQL